MDKPETAPRPSFQTHPSRYRHWTLAVEGEIARLTMKVEPFGYQDAEMEGGAGLAGDGPEPQAKAYDGGAGSAGDRLEPQAKAYDGGAGSAGDGPEPKAKA